MLNTRVTLGLKKYICVFQVSRPYLGFCPDPKRFIVSYEQTVVKFAEKWGKIYWKMQFLYKIFWQNKMLFRPTIPSFFQSWNLKQTYIFFSLKSMSGLSTCHYAGNVFLGKIVKKFGQLTWNTQNQTEKLYPLVCNTKDFKEKKCPWKIMKCRIY